MSIVYVQLTYIKRHSLIPKKYGSTGGATKFYCYAWRYREIW